MLKFNKDAQLIFYWVKKLQMGIQDLALLSSQAIIKLPISKNVADLKAYGPPYVQNQ